MRLRLCIVWCLLALLPLRGWAVAGMAMPVPAPAHAHGSTAMPCHEAAAEADADAAGTGHACHLCDLCHSGVATPPAALGALPHPFAQAPATGTARDTGRQVANRLERPPRPSAA